MKNKRKRVITVESRSQTVIYRGGVRYEIRCNICGSESVSILPENTDEDSLRRFESGLASGSGMDDPCCPLLEADTLPQFQIQK